MQDLVPYGKVVKEDEIEQALTRVKVPTKLKKMESQPRMRKRMAMSPLDTVQKNT